MPFKRHIQSLLTVCVSRFSSNVKAVAQESLSAAYCNDSELQPTYFTEQFSISLKINKSSLSNKKLAKKSILP